MATYEAWNRALIEYFTAGLAREDLVYLSVDEEAIEELGASVGVPAAQAVEEFGKSVRSKIVIGGKVQLAQVMGCDADGRPLVAAFLGAMTLAAHQMERWRAEEGETAERDTISDINYFTRLRRVLGLPEGDGGRPVGIRLNEQTEEPLWALWSRWLRSQGLTPTARPGSTTPTRFIGYPISQTLLRATDRNRLRQLFAEKQWRHDCDAETLLHRLRFDKARLTRHIQELLNPADPRYGVLGEAVQDVYSAWVADPCGTVGLGPQPLTLLRAGLFREEDPVRERVEYYLFPRMPRGRHVKSLAVAGGQATYQLTSFRPGWYWPRIPVTGADVETGRSYPVRDAPPLQAIVLPQRDFWVLTPDPEGTEAPVYASWRTGPPGLGESFILLCRSSLLEQLEILREEQILRWGGDPVPAFGNGNEAWLELRHCMVESEVVTGVRIKNAQLKEALSPRGKVAIYPAGGLRAPTGSGWLEGLGPRVRVVAFDDSAEMCVTRVSDNAEVFSDRLKTNELVQIPWPEHAGDYLLEATCRGETAGRLVRLVAWEALQAKVPEALEGLDLGSGRLCGAVLFPRE